MDKIDAKKPLVAFITDEEDDDWIDMPLRPGLKQELEEVAAKAGLSFEELIHRALEVGLAKQR